MRAALELRQGQRVIGVQPVAAAVLGLIENDHGIHAAAAQPGGDGKGLIAVERRSIAKIDKRLAVENGSVADATFAVGDVASERAAVAIVPGEVCEAAVERVMSEQPRARFGRNCTQGGLLPFLLN